jgi:hypothetical protein
MKTILDYALDLNEPIDPEQKNKQTKCPSLDQEMKKCVLCV